MFALVNGHMYGLIILVPMMVTCILRHRNSSSDSDLVNEGTAVEAHIREALEKKIDDIMWKGDGLVQPSIIRGETQKFKAGSA